MRSPLALLASALVVTPSPAQVPDSLPSPTRHVFASPGQDLHAYVFKPPAQPTSALLPAIVIFHGGGWAVGDPEWAFPRAQHFAALGLVAIAAEYRLSDQKTVTPLEGMADARAVIRWVRRNASVLGIDPHRIAAYGWSAGAHLAAAAAVLDDAMPDAGVTAIPDALILVSPAVALQSDSWVRRLLGARASVADISPDQHIRPGHPPTLILQGRDDTVTPLGGVQRYCDRIRGVGGRCELQVYPRVGHLFTPVGIPDDGQPQPDFAVQAAAMARADTFLRQLGYAGPRP